MFLIFFLATMFGLADTGLVGGCLVEWAGWDGSVSCETGVREETAVLLDFSIPDGHQLTPAENEAIVNLFLEVAGPLPHDSQMPIIMSRYSPELGGINCDHDCASAYMGTINEHWYGRVVACPASWMAPHTRPKRTSYIHHPAVNNGEPLVCGDTGGAIGYRLLQVNGEIEWVVLLDRLLWDADFQANGRSFYDLNVTFYGWWRTYDVAPWWMQ